ncbi:MAG: formylmethanofuran dehydrogenase subunit B [Pirellulales bacterium]|nr:formylmethanofuran dehydrogenase subunit B [Pirellulales bacterium]
MTKLQAGSSPVANGADADEIELRDFVCTACGCTCDDLRLTVRGSRVTAVQPPCPLAESFLRRELGAIESPCLIDGKPADVDAALARAAEILQAASAPLVMGFERATVETQRHAVELADRLGGFLDPTDERGVSRNHAAIQTVGAVTATLGEVAARSDLVVYWNVDPATTHPRHLERFARRPYSAPAAPTKLRRVITVAAARSKTSTASDEYLELESCGEAAALAVLRTLLRGGDLDLAQVAAQTGAPLEQWAYLAQRLKTAQYVALFYEPAPGEPGRLGPDVLSQGITDLVRELHRHTRAAALRLGAPWNAVGAAQVLTWQTGFPSAVSFAPGYPTYLPREASAQALLERGEVDAALIIGADPAAHLSAVARAHLATIPHVVLDDHLNATASSAAVVLFTAKFGLETAGNVFRSDAVALPLKPAVTPTLPDAAALLAKLLERIDRST